MRGGIITLVLFVAISTILTTAKPIQHINRNNRKNVIFSISDGLSNNGVSLTRQYLRDIQNNDNFLDYSVEYELDKYLVGSSRTSSANTFITDSAAGGTALASGQKTNNSALGVDVDGKAVGSILEAAKLAGYATGLVTNSYVSDATPGAFNVHTLDRTDYWYIAEQILGFRSALGRVTDVVIGGGFCPFIPQSEEQSCRPDDRNLLEEAQRAGWTIAQTPDEFNNNKEQTPFLAVFKEKAQDYEIDRDQKEAPSLVEMTNKAFELLEKKVEKENAKGIFLMIEEGIIDYAGHDNDPVAHISSTLNHQNVQFAIQEHLKHYNENGDETLVLVTSDHETGGLGIGIGQPTTNPLKEYYWNPDVISNAKHSGDWISRTLLSELNEENNYICPESVRYAFEEYSGIYDATDDEIDAVLEAGNKSSKIASVFNKAISLRARIGWTTSAHTSIDVPIYCYNHDDCKFFTGGLENVEIPHILEDFLDVDINQVSQLISNFNTNATSILGEESDIKDPNHLKF